MHLRDVVLFTTTLLAIVTPISSAVLFATMAGRFSGGIQRRMANQSAFAVLVVLLVCAWIGRPLLPILGSSVPMLQAAGGLILLLYGPGHRRASGTRALTVGMVAPALGGGVTRRYEYLKGEMMRIGRLATVCCALSVAASCSTGSATPPPNDKAGPGPQQSQVVDTIHVGPSPAGVVATAAAVYIANNNQTGPSSVGILLPKSGAEYLGAYQQTADIAGPPSSYAGTYSLTLSPDGKTLYALNSGISVAVQTISLLDTATRQFKGSLGGFNAPDAMAVLPDGKTAYVANYGFYDYKTVNVSKVDSTLYLVKLENGQVLKKIAVQRGPDSLVLSADARTLYCANVYDNSVSVIDTSTNAVTTTVTDKSILGPFTMALTPDGKSLYVTNYGNPLYPARTDNHTVTVIDTASKSVTTVIPVGPKPSGIAIAPNGRYAYVTSYESHGTVSVIDVAAAKAIQTVDVGSLPSEVAIDPAGTYAYVTNFKDHTVSVIKIPR